MDPTVTPALARRAFAVVFGEIPASSVMPVLAELTQRDLAARFRSRAMELHPDRAGALGKPQYYLEQSFKRLHAAYRVLSRVVGDPALKRRITSARTEHPAAASPRKPARDEPAGAAGPRPTGTEAADGAGRFHGGRVPDGELRFAQFLYYNRVIDWKTMIDAITWQYRVRPKVGEIGRAYHFLDFGAVRSVLNSAGRGELFGDTAMKLGILDRRQLAVMLGKQYRLNYPIGRYFVEQGILSGPEVDQLLSQNRRHNIHARAL